MSVWFWIVSSMVVELAKEIADLKICKMCLENLFPWYHRRNYLKPNRHDLRSQMAKSISSCNSWSDVKEKLLCKQRERGERVCFENWHKTFSQTDSALL